MIKGKKKSVKLDIVVYDGIESTLGPITAEELLGWENADIKTLAEQKECVIRDIEGNAVRLTRNSKNRPFRRTLALRYADEMLRGKWALNGETITIDRDGFVQSGQHRLVGLVFANQILESTILAAATLGVSDKDEEIVERWSKLRCVSIPAIIVRGIDPSPNVTNTIDLGQRRTLADVLYRDEKFGDLPNSRLKTLSAALAHALRLVYLRSHGCRMTESVYLPHSEMIEFLNKFPLLVEAVKCIDSLDGGGGIDGNRISCYLSLGNAAGLLFLMNYCDDGFEDYVPGTTIKQDVVDFWTAFASGASLEVGDPVLELRNALPTMPPETEPEEIIGMIIKAWNLVKDGKNIKRGGLRLIRQRDGENRMIISEYPTMGGLDQYNG